MVETLTDWDHLPKPSPTLRAPVRSHRRPIGAISPEGVHLRANGLGAFSGIAAYQWIRDASSRPEPVYSEADGAAWYRGEDGSLWYVDEVGDIFLWAENGEFMALSEDGLLWTTVCGELIAHTADGAVLWLRDDGSLHAFDVAGRDWTVGEDGAFYAEGADGRFYMLTPGGSYFGVDENGYYFPAPPESGFAADRPPRRKRKTRAGLRALFATFALSAALAAGLYGTHSGPFQPCVKNGGGMKLCGGVAKEYCRQISDPLVGRSATCNRLLGEHVRIGSGLDPRISRARSS
jgi:hypothetical protein